jgi:hypothetical protein
MFPIQNRLKQADVLSSLLSTLLGIHHQKGSSEPGRTEIEWDTSAFGPVLMKLI